MNKSTHQEVEKLGSIDSIALAYSFISTESKQGLYNLEVLLNIRKLAI